MDVKSLANFVFVKRNGLCSVCHIGGATTCDHTSFQSRESEPTWITSKIHGLCKIVAVVPDPYIAGIYIAGSDGHILRIVGSRAWLIQAASIPMLAKWPPGLLSLCEAYCGNLEDEYYEVEYFCSVRSRVFWKDVRGRPFILSEEAAEINDLILDCANRSLICLLNYKVAPIPLKSLPSTIYVDDKRFGKNEASLRRIIQCANQKFYILAAVARNKQTILQWEPADDQIIPRNPKLNTVLSIYAHPTHHLLYARSLEWPHIFTLDLRTGHLRHLTFFFSSLSVSAELMAHPKKKSGRKEKSKFKKKHQKDGDAEDKQASMKGELIQSLGFDRTGKMLFVLKDSNIYKFDILSGRGERIGAIIQEKTVSMRHGCRGDFDIYQEIPSLLSLSGLLPSVGSKADSLILFDNRVIYRVVLSTIAGAEKSQHRKDKRRIPCII